MAVQRLQWLHGRGLRCSATTTAFSRLLISTTSAELVRIASWSARLQLG